MINNAQHAHIYRIHTLHFIFGENLFLKILSIQPLLLLALLLRYILLTAYLLFLK